MRHFVFWPIFGSVKEPKELLCLSVCLSGTKCSKALNLHLSLKGQSQVSLGSLCTYFVKQTEPKILRLVIETFLYGCIRLNVKSILSLNCWIFSLFYSIPGYRFEIYEILRKISHTHYYFQIWIYFTLQTSRTLIFSYSNFWTRTIIFKLYIKAMTYLVEFH